MKHLLLVAGLTVAMPLAADHDEARKLKEAGEILPLETVLQNARALHPGQVLEVELEDKRSGYIYEVELLDEQGRVWEMKFDAHTGELLRKKREKD